MIRRAAEQLGVDPEPLAADQLGDLVRVSQTAVTFRHPLMRAAVYHGATDHDRRVVHQALASALESEPTQTQRRAWHLGRAANRPDERVARLLEESTGGGSAAAGAALERAAELSESARAQAGRLVAAATAWWESGDAARASALLDRAEAVGSLSAAAGLDAVALRATLELRRGTPSDAVALLSTVIPMALRGDLPRAMRAR